MVCKREEFDVYVDAGGWLVSVHNRWRSCAERWPGGWAIFSMLGLILVVLALIQRALDVLGKTLKDRE